MTLTRPNVAAWGIPVVLAALTLLAYSNSFRVPFLFDDGPAIVENASIRRLWPVGEVLAPDLPAGVTTSGRPIANLSFAFNYAVSETEVWSYHLLNVLIHLGAGLTLYGLVRRTAERLHASGPFPDAALWSGLVAALWLLHPLQTAAVTYIVQRTEALGGWCVLITLYAFLRGAGASSTSSRWSWFAGSIAATWLGMATKETVAVAPLLVLWYDRVFISGSWREVWQRHRAVHLGLASAWVLLALLVSSHGGRGDSAGFESGVDPIDYLLTQAAAITRYLRLVFWPQGLTFDYGYLVLTDLGALWFPLIVVTTLLMGTAVAAYRWPPWGFLGGWFFVTLAPSSSLVPIATQTIAEHRMYLALAAPLALGVWAARHWLRWAGATLLAVAALGAAAATFARNEVYRSPRAIWEDTTIQAPHNARGWHNLGEALFMAGDAAGAETHYRTALRLRPKSPETHYNLGLSLAHQRRWAEAIRAYEAALHEQPRHPEAQNNLGNAWLAQGRPDLALQAYERAIAERPNFGEAYSNLCNALTELGRFADAISAGEKAVELNSRSATAQFNLGIAYAQAARWTAARQAFERCLQLDPAHVGAYNNLANVLLELNELPEAVLQFEQALTLRPGLEPARRTVIQVLAHLGRYDEAIRHCETLLQQRPGDRDASRQLRELQQAARRGR